MGYTNAQILAAVVTEWSRPAISQLAADRLCRIPAMQSIQQQIAQSGIVGQSYSISKDVAPLVKPVVNSLIRPMLENYFARIPDEAIPDMARKIVAQMEQTEKYSILDGFITFDKSDIRELSVLVEKNLPLPSSNYYEVLK